MERKPEEEENWRSLHAMSFRIVTVVALNVERGIVSNQNLFQTSWLKSSSTLGKMQFVVFCFPTIRLRTQGVQMVARKFFAVVALIGLVGIASAQAPKPADKQTDKREKGQLPTYWKQLGLTDEQVQKVYKLQGKINDEIDTHEAKIKELKEKMAKERMTILTKEQKDRLEAIIKEKAGTTEKK
jgi:hypothetical protein